MLSGMLTGFLPCRYVAVVSALDLGHDTKQVSIIVKQQNLTTCLWLPQVFFLQIFGFLIPKLLVICVLNVFYSLFISYVIYQNFL